MQDEEAHFSEVSCFLPVLFQRFCLDFTCLYAGFGIQWTPFPDTSCSKAAIKILVKSWKTSFEEVHF